MTEQQFTFSTYETLLQELEDRGYQSVDFADSRPSKSVIHRHDVDYSPRKAMEMARIEAERGVRATYFVLVSSLFYNVLDPDVREALEEIESLGHRIGLHFDTATYWEERPSEPELAAAIADEREVLETVVEETAEPVAFHNPPEWVLGRTFDAFTSTYEPRYFEEIAYVADSNQRWRDADPFAEWPDAFQLLTHPVLWGDEPGGVVERLRSELDHLHERHSEKLAEQNPIWAAER